MPGGNLQTTQPVLRAYSNQITSGVSGSPYVYHSLPTGAPSYGPAQLSETYHAPQAYRSAPTTIAPTGGPTSPLMTAPPSLSAATDPSKIELPKF